MERFDIIKQMQWSNDLASLANQAGRGLKNYIKGDNSEQTKRCISDGIRLCNFLKQACEASKLDAITPEQLKVIKIFAPLRKIGLKPDDLIEETIEALSVLERVLKKEEVEKETISKVLCFLGQLSDDYLEVAHSILITSRSTSEF